MHHIFAGYSCAHACHLSSAPTPHRCVGTKALQHIPAGDLALLQHDKPLAKGNSAPHLKHIPAYLRDPTIAVPSFPGNAGKGGWLACILRCSVLDMHMSTDGHTDCESLSCFVSVSLLVRDLHQNGLLSPETTALYLVCTAVSMYKCMSLQGCPIAWKEKKRLCR